MFLSFAPSQIESIRKRSECPLARGAMLLLFFLIVLCLSTGCFTRRREEVCCVSGAGWDCVSRDGSEEFVRLTESVLYIRRVPSSTVLVVDCMDFVQYIIGGDRIVMSLRAGQERAGRLCGCETFVLNAGA